MAPSAVRPRARAWAAAFGAVLLAVPLVLLPVVRLAPAPGASEIVRVRFIANSDSAFDQAAKAAVRDAVLAAFGPRWRSAPSAADLARRIQEDLPQVAAVAREAALAAGAHYRVDVAFEDAWFPAERLGPLLLAPGREPSLIITLGAGRGRNWWGVLFPPLALLPVPWDALSAAGATPGAIDLAALDPALREALRTALAESSEASPSEAVVAFRLEDDSVLVVDRRLLGGDASRPEVELRSYFADALREAGHRLLKALHGFAALAQARP